MKHVLVTVLFAFCVFTTVAQDSTVQHTTPQDTIVQPNDSSAIPQEIPEEKWAKNVIKLNLTSLVQLNYMLQYERVTAKKQSVAISIGYATNVDLPFKSTLLDQFDENDDAKSAVETTTFDKLTITPEYRFYLGKKRAPQGFYIAPFLRYSHMTTEGDYIFHTQSDIDADDGSFHTAHLKGTFDGWGGGVMVGAQWLFGKKKNISLDWWILGGGYGALDGDFHGTGSMDDMDAQEKLDLESDIENTDIPGWDIEATVGNDVVDATVKGPFYAIRAFGICIGFRF